MTCTVCGSNANCGCSSCVTDPALPCGCGTVSPGGCCQNVVPSTPTPFFACAPACPESHVQKITIQQFSADIKIADSWNIPACGESAIVNGISLRAIVVGSYLWNPDFGYFEVTAFNSGTGQMTILNHCTVGNAAVGTNVPACTEFTVTVPPCDCGTDSQVCVAIDFTAPDNGDCIDITLTSTNGITASDTIQIGTGFYFVDAVKPNDIITICNQGEGITPGTSVIARDINGNYQYCISIISSNPCDRTAETDGTVLICNADGLQVPLTGETDSEDFVLTLLDVGTGDAAYRSLNITKFRDSESVSDPSVPFTLDHTANTHDSPSATYMFTTGDRAIDMIVNVLAELTFGVVNGNSDTVNFQRLVAIQLNGGGFITIAGENSGPFFTSSDASKPFQPLINATHIFLNLAANTTHTIDVKVALSWLADNSGSAVFAGINIDADFLGF